MFWYCGISRYMFLHPERALVWWNFVLHFFVCGTLSGIVESSISIFVCRTHCGNVEFCVIFSVCQWNALWYCIVFCYISLYVECDLMLWNCFGRICLNEQNFPQRTLPLTKMSLYNQINPIDLEMKRNQSKKRE